jgi:hypothetical protein
MSKSAVYLASIGHVPNLYHERRINVYQRQLNKHWNNKHGVDARRKLKKLKKWREAESREQRGLILPERKPINLDKSKMSLKEKYRINLEVDNAFKYTTLLDNRQYELSTNAIKLSFTSLVNNQNQPKAKPKLSVNSDQRNKKPPVDSLVFPNIFKA